MVFSFAEILVLVNKFNFYLLIRFNVLKWLFLHDLFSKYSKTFNFLYILVSPGDKGFSSLLSIALGALFYGVLISFY